MPDSSLQTEIEKQPANLERNRKLFKKYLVIFLMVFLLIGSFGLGYERGKEVQRNSAEEPLPLTSTVVKNKFPSKDAAKQLDFSLFWQTWDLLKEKYVNTKDLDARKLMYGAIQGMLKAAGDPYTTFFDPEETKSFSQDIEGSFEGIGAELGIKDDILTVIAPLEDSPAQKAGLRAGDKILKIDDKPTTDMTIYAAVDLIRGKKGTEVKLTIFRKGEEETKEISIIRDTIIVKSVKLEFKEGGIAYLKVTKFGEDTSKEFDAAMRQIIDKNTRGIILDLRNNPGGLLDKAVDLASRMMPKGKIVVAEEDNAGKKNTLRTYGGDKLSALPTVVLINEGSASASEILAGALRDNQGIQLIGKKSFGKGSVQEFINLPGGTSVKITVAKWMTPKGDNIMEKGISPDIEIDLTAEDIKNDRDPQLDKALELIKEKIK